MSRSPSRPWRPGSGVWRTLRRGACGSECVELGASFCTESDTLPVSCMSAFHLPRTSTVSRRDRARTDVQTHCQDCDGPRVRRVHALHIRRGECRGLRRERQRGASPLFFGVLRFCRPGAAAICSPTLCAQTGRANASKLLRSGDKVWSIFTLPMKFEATRPPYVS
jgi:hypothetical protein